MRAEFPGEEEQVALLECNLDDMTGEELGHILGRLFDAGALDVWFTPVFMKKNRPGVVLSVLCALEKAPRLRALILAETSTLGVRWQVFQREVAERKVVQVETPWGPVRCKLKMLEGHVVGVKPEFDDCARLAREQGIPLEEVLAEARKNCQAFLQ